MKSIGFSTGAVSLGDFRRALYVLAPLKLPAIELSALRMHEVVPLIEAIEELKLENYSYVSFHAPSTYEAHEEAELVGLLTALPAGWPIVVHPDSIKNFSLWASLGTRVAIENMDRRKPIGRTAKELERIFELLPLARMCFDIGHARQFDSSMSEAYLILAAFRDRVVQVHVSEVDTANRHERISYAAAVAFRQVSGMLPQNVPLIIESRVPEEETAFEALRTKAIFEPTTDAAEERFPTAALSWVGW